MSFYLLYPFFPERLDGVIILMSFLYLMYFSLSVNVCMNK